MSLKVDYVDLGLNNVANNDFFIVDLSEKINGVFISSLVENFSRGITVNDTLLHTRFVHSDKNKSSFEGSWCTKNLEEGGLEFDGLLVFENHIWISNNK